MRALIFAALLVLTPTPLAAEQIDDRLECDAADNRKLCDLYREDQEARRPPVLSLARLENPQAARDAGELARDRNALRSGNDYFRVATLLLHSSKPEDNLLGHIVATRGLMRAARHARVRLLAALSLDRFLVAKGQKQIFGTQTMGSDKNGPRWFPYDCILNDDIRRAFIGDYPEPCRARANMPGKTRSTQRALLLKHVRSVKRLLDSPPSRAARRRAAESLDAFLLTIGEPQVFGTHAQRKLSVARLDCTLLSADIREAFVVDGPCAQGPNRQSHPITS